MDLEDRIRFNEAFKNFYRSCYEREKAENKMLWDALLAMINVCGAIEVPPDISSWSASIEDARTTALQWAETLRHYLDERRT